MPDASEGAKPTSSFYAPNSGADYIGTGGADALWGTAGKSQRMAGGGGDDTYYLKGLGNMPVEAIGEGIDTVVAWMSYTLGANVENLTVSGSNLKATGNALANIIKGGAGAQTINGMAGNDLLSGGVDSDIFVVTSGNGSDTITDFSAVAGGDTLRLGGYGFASVASVRAAATQVGGDTVITLGGGETLMLRGVSLTAFQGATITLEGAPAPPVVIPMPPAQASAAPSNWINGTSPTLLGTDKHDAIYVSHISQTVAGGKGDDTYSLYGPGNAVVERVGEGTDTVEVWTSYILGANVENLTVVGDDLYARGNELNNVLKGGSGDQTLNAEKGSDVLSGGAGSDTFTFDKGDGSDVITDFQTGQGGDILRLNGYGFADVDAVKAAATQVGADTVITLGGGETLTLKNVNASSLVRNNVAEAASSAGRALVFEDNFNGFSMRGAQNPEGTWKTTHYWGEGRTLTSNNERQWYMDPEYKGLGYSPFAVRDGALTITATKTPEAIKAQVGHYDYLSGLITSEQSFAIQYGYFEMRAELPEGRAMWPAWWLLTVNGKSPMEIDIFEVLGSDPSNVLTTVHTNETGTKTATGDLTGVADSSNGFHTYGLDWGPNEIVWYFDSVEVFRTRTPADMHDPMYMLINLAVGGWQGAPDATTLVDPTMKIDYVRVYERGLDHAVLTVPTAWDTMDQSDFSTMDSTGAVTKWGYSNAMTASETKMRMADQWGYLAFGNDRDNYIEGANGQYNEIDGKGGDDVLKGNGGVDVFVIRDGGGDDAILDFSQQDKVELDGFHFSHYADVKAWMTQQGSDVILRLDEDQALLLRNVQIQDLASENFYFINVDEMLL